MPTRVHVSMELHYCRNGDSLLTLLYYIDQSLTIYVFKLAVPDFIGKFLPSQ